MLVDTFQRRFKYLRLSLTEVCNFRCGYCLPNGFEGKRSKSYLSGHEIENLLKSFAEMGVEKVRLTGGEPTLRSDILSILDIIRRNPRIQELAMTTNGYRLNGRLKEYKSAGLDAINISMDSLDPEIFRQVTGKNEGLRLAELIDEALKTGFQSVKVNAVLLKGLNDHELPRVLEWLRYRDIEYRFIELMHTPKDPEYFRRHHLRNQVLISQLQDMGWLPVDRRETAGPAQSFKHPAFAGRIGFISPYAANFCANCNRLRVSARGQLRLCLWGEGEQDLRSLCQSPHQGEELKERIYKALHLKPEAHELHLNRGGDLQTLSQIGG